MWFLEVGEGMANFRCERLFVMLDEPVPGLDHLKAVDVAEFAWHDSDGDAEALGLKPLGDFTFAPFERRRWRPASEGLKTVRALIKFYGKGPDGEGQDAAEGRTKRLDVLRQVEAVLDAADGRDRRFYLSARDLG